MAAVCCTSTMFNGSDVLQNVAEPQKKLTIQRQKKVSHIHIIHPMRSNRFRITVNNSKHHAEICYSHWAAKLFSRRKYISAIDLGGLWMFWSWNTLTCWNFPQNCKRLGCYTQKPFQKPSAGMIIASTVYTSWWGLRIIGTMMYCMQYWHGIRTSKNS